MTYIAHHARGNQRHEHETEARPTHHSDCRSVVGNRAGRAEAGGATADRNVARRGIQRVHDLDQVEVAFRETLEEVGWRLSLKVE
jgi:hypothetical protein